MTDIAPARDLPNPNAWYDNAACLEHDSETFYPTEMNLNGAHQAISICEGCEVRLECLTAALQEEKIAFGRRHGIRGGLTPTQRMQLVRGVPVKPVPSTVETRRKIA